MPHVPGMNMSGQSAQKVKSEEGSASDREGALSIFRQVDMPNVEEMKKETQELRNELKGYSEDIKKIRERSRTQLTEAKLGVAKEDFTWVQKQLAFSPLLNKIPYLRDFGVNMAKKMATNSWEAMIMGQYRDLVESKDLLQQNMDKVDELRGKYGPSQHRLLEMKKQASTEIVSLTEICESEIEGLKRIQSQIEDIREKLTGVDLQSSEAAKYREQQTELEKERLQKQTDHNANKRSLGLAVIQYDIADSQFQAAQIWMGYLDKGYEVAGDLKVTVNSEANAMKENLERSIASIEMAESLEAATEILNGSREMMNQLLVRTGNRIKEVTVLAYEEMGQPSYTQESIEYGRKVNTEIAGFIDGVRKSFLQRARDNPNLGDPEVIASEMKALEEEVAAMAKAGDQYRQASE